VAGLRERKKDRTRATLIETAIGLCERQGFDRTTVEQIAALADVSPRTFSRYFATKDAVIHALVDEIVEAIAVQLLRQPAELSELDALRAAHVDMLQATKSAPPGGLTAERFMTTVRIVCSSPPLLASSEHRRDAVIEALARRMGVGVDERKVQLAIAVWWAVILVAVADWGPDTDWQQWTADMVVGRIDDTFAQFGELIARVRQPVASLPGEIGSTTFDAGFVNTASTQRPLR
jgi:AcrR family transcriptional regulator